jgi:hypothetical protein
VAIVWARDSPFNQKIRSNRRSNVRGNPPGQWASKLCDNETLAHEFLTEVRQLITTLQTNGSYGRVLQDHTQTIAYIQSDPNAAVLSSNCTGYFVGLQNAQKLDQNAEEQQEQYEENLDFLYIKIIQSLVGTRVSINEGF